MFTGLSQTRHRVRNGTTRTHIYTHYRRWKGCERVWPDARHISLRLPAHGLPAHAPILPPISRLRTRHTTEVPRLDIGLLLMEAIAACRSSSHGCRCHGGREIGGEEEGGVRVNDGMMSWALGRRAQSYASHHSPYAYSKLQLHQKRSLVCVRG